MKFKLAGVVTLALSLAFPAHANFTGKVVSVTDGDTLTVLRDRVQVKVRLIEVDAPEKSQPFGNRSKQALSELVHGKDVRVVEKGQDRNKRILGRVYCGDLDVNSEMVRIGMAWVYRQYVSKSSPLFEIEVTAKAEQLGLWADKDPMPPWEWRMVRKVGAQNPK